MDIDTESMDKDPNIKSYYQMSKEYLSDKLLRSETQLRRAEDNGCPPQIITILHQLTKQLRRIYKDLFFDN